MKSAFKPALDNLGEALGRLESVVEQQLRPVPQKPAPDVSKKIAARLDQTINRLEMLLSED